MTHRQVIVGALVIAGVCCAVMWFLEDFNRQRMISEMRDWLDTLPERKATE